MATIERVFMDIDTQFDFLDPAGRLYVPGAVEITGALELLFELARNLKIPVFSTVDEHPPGDPEFERFGTHCLRGTPGQRKLPITLMENPITLRSERALPGDPTRLLIDHDQLIFPKTTLNVFDNPHFPALIEALDVSEFIVFGVATDYCVLLLEASGLMERGQRVTIVRDAIRGIAPATTEQACRKLSALGAQWAESADVIRNVEKLGLKA